MDTQISSLELQRNQRHIQLIFEKTCDHTVLLVSSDSDLALTVFRPFTEQKIIYVTYVDIAFTIIYKWCEVHLQVCIYALPLVSNWEDPVRSKLFGTNLWVESEEPILLRSNRKSLETPWWGHMAKYKRRVLKWEFSPPSSWMSKSTIIKGKHEILRFWWFNWTYTAYTLK